MKRENFGSQFGTIMAMTGSAVGLGNLWRYPYMVGVYGGAAFVLVYIIVVFLLCLPILNSEMIAGRRSQTNAFKAFNVLAPGSKWKWAGVLMVFTPLVVLSYYSVIGGWSLEYLYKALCFDFTASAHTRAELDSIFGNFISSAWTPLIGHTIFLGMTAMIVVLGVKKGIENFGKVMMPLLFLLVILIAVRSATLPGAGEGFAYLFKPDFSKITPAVCAAALGQGFFSLSVGFGIMLTYASYMNRKDSIGKSSVLIAVSDTMFALIASCAIMPAVFSFGLSPEAGPSLLFEVLPFIFSQMPLGGVVAIIFFIALLVAALTSSISILEVGVAWLRHLAAWRHMLPFFRPVVRGQDIRGYYLRFPRYVHVQYSNDGRGPAYSDICRLEDEEGRCPRGVHQRGDAEGIRYGLLPDVFHHPVHRSRSDSCHYGDQSSVVRQRVCLWSKLSYFWSETEKLA